MIAEIESTPGLMDDIKKALAFEQSIYDYGKQLHSRQKQELLSAQVH